VTQLVQERQQRCRAGDPQAEIAAIGKDHETHEQQEARSDVDRKSKKVERGLTCHGNSQPMAP